MQTNNNCLSQEKINEPGIQLFTESSAFEMLYTVVWRSSNDVGCLRIKGSSFYILPP